MLLLYTFLGLMVGSFTNALVYRIETGKVKSILTDRSRCPKCKKKIVWYDNIPLLSYLLLKGKCRQCKKKISLAYPVIEIVSALVFMILYFSVANCSSIGSPVCTWYSSIGNEFLFLGFAAVLYIALSAIFIIDTKHQIIPDELSLGAFAFVSIFIVFFRPQVVYVNLLTGFTMAIVFLMLNILTKGRGMGLGDSKLSLFSGVLVGFPNILMYFYTSFIIGSVFGVSAIILGKRKFGKRIPFGPFLVLGTLISFIWPINLTMNIFPFL